MILLKYSLEKIKYDIIGLAEVRRNGNSIIEDEDHIFCYTGESKGLHGVGFLIKKKYKNNIDNYIGISERVCLLNLRFTAMKISIIQIYAPTSDANEEEIDAFYDDIEKARSFTSEKVILLGDLNAKIGQRKPEESTILGPYCYGKRNSRGEKLIQYALKNKFTIINSIFKKNTKHLWTWITPDKKTRNQIDYILSNHPKLFTNIEIINKLSFPSDHRLLRGTISLDIQKKSRANFDSTPTITLSNEKSQETYLSALRNQTGYYRKPPTSLRKPKESIQTVKLRKKLDPDIKYAKSHKETAN
ncbi:unnamed protein product [Colias eurytheme]|nr:unnamed protein product [Colias eurytheme]